MSRQRALDVDAMMITRMNRNERQLMIVWLELPELAVPLNPVWQDYIYMKHDMIERQPQ